MKKEYKIIAAGCLYGFMEGNAKCIEENVIRRMKYEHGVEPDLVHISTSNPYSSLHKDGGTPFENDNYNLYPVITLSMKIDGVAWTITRDAQSEADRDKIREKTDSDWKPLWDCVSYEDYDNIKQLIEEGKL